MGVESRSMDDDNKEATPTFRTDLGFLERHIILQCAVQDLRESMTKHWFSSSIYGTVSLVISIGVGYSANNFWLAFYFVLGSFGIPLLSLAVKSFSVAPVRVVRKQLQDITDLEADKQSINRKLVVAKRDAVTVDGLTEEIEYYKTRLAPKLKVDLDTIECVTTRYPYQQQAAYCRVARFEIENTGEMTVYDVKASIVSFGVEPDRLDGMVLHRADEFGDTRGSFNLSGGDKQVIDIVKRLDSPQSVGAFFRLAAPSHVSRTLGEVTVLGLQIRVTAQDHPSIDFCVDLYYRDVPYQDNRGSGIDKQLMCRKSDRDSMAIIDL